MSEDLDLDPVERTRLLAAAALERKALDVVAIDLRGLSSFADAFLVATGTSDRHARAVADAVTEAARACGMSVLGTEGYDEGRWILIDLGDVVAHVFQAKQRDHYDLERLWGDAPRLAVGAEEPPAGEARR